MIALREDNFEAQARKMKRFSMREGSDHTVLYCKVVKPHTVITSGHVEASSVGLECSGFRQWDAQSWVQWEED